MPCRNGFDILIPLLVSLRSENWICVQALLLKHEDAHVAVTADGSFTVLARFYESAVSATFVEEGIRGSTEKIDGDSSS